MLRRHQPRPEPAANESHTHPLHPGAVGAKALAATRKGGTVVCAGIHMSAIPSFDTQ